MEHKDSELVKCQMMIRKPAKEVFQAFIDPKMTTNFWFTKSSGTLKKGETILWEWEVYGISTPVKVMDIIENEKITIEWDEPATTVDFEFEPISIDKTYVTIKQYDFNVTGDEMIETIKDSTGGFTTVLDGLKAYLEHDINLNLIADKYPKIAH